MFTTVNSDKKNLRHQKHLDASKISYSNNSELIENKFSISQKFVNFFSINDDYLILQLSIFALSFIISLVFTTIAIVFISFSFGLSIFLGSIAGIFYLRLLAKNIGNLGRSSSGVSKVQLLIPICLFIIASNNELLQILPAILGFFIYKPALIFYFSRTK